MLERAGKGKGEDPFTGKRIALWAVRRASTLNTGSEVCIPCWLQMLCDSGAHLKFLSVAVVCSGVIKPALDALHGQGLY